MKLTLFLGAAFAFFATLTAAISLSDLVIIQGGKAHGGCDDHLDILELWLKEAILTLDNAIATLENHYNQDSELGRKVRQSMFDFFHIPQDYVVGSKLAGTANTISKNMIETRRWLKGGTPDIEREKNYLFCGSDFLVQRGPGDVAQDEEGNNIIVNGKPVPIEQIPSYKTLSKKGNVAWWSGDRSDLNGYWFEEPSSGANYCRDPSDPEFDGDNSNLGLTGIIKTVSLSKGNTPKPRTALKQLIILCPRAFMTKKFHNSFQQAAASPEMKPGRDLEWALSKSMTLAHEAYHVVHGSSFNEGGQYETYGLAKCVELAGSDNKQLQSSSRINPENYVYLASALHYLVHKDLPKRWDFCESPGSAKAFD